MANHGIAFVYEPLPLDDWIRLLRILPGRGPLHGELIPARTTGETHYEALSYTWGNPEKTEALYVNGSLLPLTANCASAIRNLRHPREPRVVWIDAVCINQNDQDEKGHEVNMMGEIYSRAARTVVYLGPGDGTVRFLRGAQKLDYGSIAIRHDHVDAFEDARQRLLRRDWFNRKWIVQEVLLSQELVVQCGAHVFTWRELETLDRDHQLEIVRLARKYLHPSSMSSAVINGQDWDSKAKAAWDELFEQGEVVDRNAHAANVPRYSKYRAPGTGFLMPPQLFDILCATSDFACKEPRDRVFAILSLFARKLQITTSYACSEDEVYHSLNKELLALGDTRMLWIEDRDSWRPRWSSALGTLSDFVNAHGEHSRKNRQRTDIGRLWREGGQEGRIGVDSSVWMRLWQTPGVLLGSISSLSTSPLKHHRAAPGEMSTGNSERNLPLWRSALESLGLAAKEYEDGTHPLAHIHQRNRHQVEWFRHWTLDLFSRSSLKSSQQDSYDAKSLARAMTTHHGHMSFCKEMILFQCTSQPNGAKTLLGLGTQSLRENDKVFFLPGTSCPFVVLRPLGRQWYFVALCWFGPLRLFPSCYGKNLSMFEKHDWHSLEVI